MSVTKYRDVAEMPSPSPAAPRDAALFARIRELWRFSDRLVAPLYAPGVSRYRSIEEADAARESALLQRMRATRRP